MKVMTGFRIDYGCAQTYFGVTPDVTTLGKVIGGGLPVGAYGGRRDIMEMVAPAGPMYQAGTLSGNPLAMTAGLKTMEILQRCAAFPTLLKRHAAAASAPPLPRRAPQTHAPHPTPPLFSRPSRPGAYEHMDNLTKRLIEGIIAEGKAAGHAVCGGHIRGMFGFFFCEGPVKSFEDATGAPRFPPVHPALSLSLRLPHTCVALRAGLAGGCAPPLLGLSAGGSPTPPLAQRRTRRSLGGGTGAC